MVKFSDVTNMPDVGDVRIICFSNPDHEHAKCWDNKGKIYIEKLMPDGAFHVEQLVRNGWN
jgi:hypothetical protein